MSFKQPLITVAIPAFNHERYVKHTLDSILDSGLSEVEVIVCDDASSDATPTIIREWGEQNSARLVKFTFIEKKRNTGLCASLNEMIHSANGEIIHVIGSDDYYLPGGLASKTQAMLENPGWISAFCDGQAVGLNGELYEPSLLAVSKMNPARLIPEHIAEELLYHWDVPANLHSWRRTAFKIHGGDFEFDPTVFCEDFDGAWWSMARQSHGFIPTICQAYRYRSWPQTSNRNHTREFRDISHVLAKNARFFGPRLSQAMNNLSEAHHAVAIGDTEAATIRWKRHEENEAAYLERVNRPESEPENSIASAPIPTEQTTFVSYAQNFEDVYLWRALKQVKKGFYIDVGAHDPVTDSVTQAFYDHGWSGINIEPVPSSIQKFVTTRPNDLNLKLAVSDTQGVSLIHEVTGTGLSTLIKDTAIDHAQDGRQVVEHMVDTTTLAEICRNHAPQDIHFLKIDVEGGELAVLRGADFKTFRPWIVLVEATLPNDPTETHSAWESLLLEQDYVFLYFDGLNRYYSSREKASEMSPHFTRPANPFDYYVLHTQLVLLQRIAEQQKQLEEAEEKLQRLLSEKNKLKAKKRPESTFHKEEYAKMKHLLRYHQSNPLRAIKLWWKH